jgi:hypothetical protein
VKVGARPLFTECGCNMLAAISGRRGQRSLSTNGRLYLIAGSLPGNDVNI